MTRYARHDRVRHVPWTASEVRALKALLAAGVTYESAGEGLRLLGFPMRTGNAVMGQMARQRAREERT